MNLQAFLWITAALGFVVLVQAVIFHLGKHYATAEKPVSYGNSFLVLKYISAVFLLTGALVGYLLLSPIPSFIAVVAHLVCTGRAIASTRSSTSPSPHQN